MVSTTLELAHNATPQALIPMAPNSIGELGVSESLVTELFLKHAYQSGTTNISRISESLRVPIGLGVQLFQRLKAQSFIEVKGTYGEDFTFSLSGAGKNAALERMSLSPYCGSIPVPLAKYQKVIKSQVTQIRVTRERVREAYSDLTLDDALVERLGPALFSRRAIILYGPSGTGKSALAERILRIYHDSVAIPHAVEAEGGIVSVFDPAIHEPANAPDDDHDPRWVYCRRPCVVVGGELTSGMLELQKDEASGCYAAPLHMKANNGIFVIDDFGRQLLSPRELLNRWIVPLDRRIDFLNMGNGSKFAIPFEVSVVFSTNLDPSELADEAFLRRIPNKILVDAIPAWVFDDILLRKLADCNWAAEAGAGEYLREICQTRGGDLRPCYPRDFFRIMESIAGFEERTATLNRVDIDRAADLYFGKMLKATAKD